MYFYEKNWLFSHEIKFSGSRMQLFKNKKHLNTREAEWIEGARRGDRRSQKAIYDLLSAKMFAVCLRYMGERDAAEDILQDGFVTLFSKLDSYSGEGSFEGWARKIFVNTALMSLRKKDALKNSEDVDAAWNITSDDPNAIQKIGYNDLMKMIAALPPGFRTVFNMYVVEGYSHKEIAEALGISETTSRSQLQRARVLLQSKIKERY
jgi:RNA polymerase sigma-70 factor (ECF subfamily)